jgi:hypothetical protein
MKEKRERTRPTPALMSQGCNSLQKRAAWGKSNRDLRSTSADTTFADVVRISIIEHHSQILIQRR